MSEVAIKPGDTVWVRTTVAGVDGGLVEAGDGRLLVLRASVIPDSPALPAVARWLAELTPDGGAGLRAVLARADELQPRVDFPMGGVRDGLVALTDLIAALEGAK